MSGSLLRIERTLDGSLIAVFAPDFTPTRLEAASQQVDEVRQRIAEAVRDGEIEEREAARISFDLDELDAYLILRDEVNKNAG